MDSLFGGPKIGILQFVAECIVLVCYSIIFFAVLNWSWRYLGIPPLGHLGLPR